jgi:hypothetical protein
VVATGPFSSSTRLVGWCLLTGTLAVLGFWIPALRLFPAIGRGLRLWLISSYAVGVGSLGAGLAGVVWAAAAEDRSAVLRFSGGRLAAEVGKHLGFPRIDGRGRWRLAATPRRRSLVDAATSRAPPPASSTIAAATTRLCRRGRAAVRRAPW